MGSCNTQQNEIGGKSLLLKVCLEKTYSTNGTTADINTTAAHKLKVGDVVRFLNVGAATNLVVGQFYYVKTIIDTDTFRVSVNAAGTEIIPDAAITAQKVDTFRSVGGLRAKSFSFSSEGIDITNQESEEWKVMLDGAGIRSLSVSGSGVYTNEEVFQALYNAALTNALICLMFIDVTTFAITSGCMKVTSMEVSGDYDAEGQYSMSAESSGPVAFVTL